MSDENGVLKPLGLRKTDRLIVGLLDDNPDEFKLLIKDSREGGYFPSKGASKEFPERFPEGQVSSTGSVLTTPATDTAAMLIRDLWPADQVEFTDDAKVVYRYLLAIGTLQESAALRTAQYHQYTAYRAHQRKNDPDGLSLPPDFTEEFSFANELSPMLHQRVARDNGRGNDGVLYAMEQGTGKTGVIIAEVDRDAVNPDLGRQLFRVIIVCPKNVMRNWKNEFERFSTVEGQVIILNHGGDLDRRIEIVQGCVPKTKTQRYVIFIIAYESCTNSLETLLRIPWHMGVLDESHFIKWHGTKRWKAIVQLRDVCEKRRCLTGTPVCNTPNDLWTQLEFLGKGRSGFKTFPAFRRFYGVYKSVDPKRGISRLVEVQNLPLMQERLGRCAFIVRKSEALPDLPAKTYDFVAATMTKEQQEIYDAVKEQLYFELKDELNDETRTINPQNILTKLLRLAQITSGFVTLDPVVDFETGETVAPKVIEAIDPNPKLEELIGLFKDPENDGELIKDSTQKTLIAATWVWDINTISRRLTDEGIANCSFFGATRQDDRDEAVRRFNEDPEMRVMIVNPAAGGVGLNLLGYDYWHNPEPTLETNCDHVVFYSQGWSSSQRSQFEDRPHRTGTRVSVRYTDIVVPGTIDEEIRARVLNKQRMALEVQDVRGFLERILGKKF